MNNYFKAKRSVPQCDRCKSWHDRGLSYHCPTCDELVLQKFDKLENTEEDTDVKIRPNRPTSRVS